ncbi:MAG: hypothetical protein ACLP1Y_15120 [Candidatus Acidiferrales bacterium]
MRIPDRLSERLPFFEAFGEDWQPVPLAVTVSELVFFSLMLFSAATGGAWIEWMDLVFVPIHEGGHLLFRFFGEWIMVAGGTFLQLFVPFALAVYFVFRRQLPGTAFCGFFLFEQLLPVGIYMADARCQCLNYVTVGDPDTAVHDWWYLFSSVGLVEHDTQIGAVVRVIGWMGMIATVAWFGVQALQRRSAAAN